MKKVAIVTGASRGIGRACALRLAKEGINVVVNYNMCEKKANEVVEEIRAIGTDALAIKADVSNFVDVKRLIKESYQYFGSIDILINNAGIVDDSFLLMLSEESLNRSIDVNIKGYFNCCKEVALKMFKNKKGKIINISSVSSIMALEGQSVYSATKGAINALTRTLAKELGQYGIQVNSVAPGFIETDMTDKIPKNKRDEYIKYIPAKRFGTVDEVAEIVNYLCKKEADYITGQVIVIDGGVSL